MVPGLGKIQVKLTWKSLMKWVGVLCDEAKHLSTFLDFYKRNVQGYEAVKTRFSQSECKCNDRCNMKLHFL